jgi:16S rRNA (guanine(966)-N(2))-methyltransferase RsmD
MRVIAGSLKGRRLKSPSWIGLRPTSDKLRETLFNILAPRIVGARVLDGYAGTGAIGIEALSRGADAVTFVECEPRAQELVADNLERCGLREGYAIIRADIRRAFARLRDAGDAFDIVLLDPPYSDEPDDVLNVAAGVMCAGGVLVIEHRKGRPTPLSAGGLMRTRQVASGDTILTFYELSM